jgi:hypothetical protein
MQHLETHHISLQHVWVKMPRNQSHTTRYVEVQIGGTSRMFNYECYLYRATFTKRLT